MVTDSPSPIQVLVVDDDTATRRTVMDLLESAGYLVAGAATAAEARHLAEDREPAIAILDLVLPDGDGLQLIDDLRATWPAMPALVTGHVETRRIVEAMRRGALDYLPTPVDPDALLAACREAVARPSPLAAVVPMNAPAIVGESAAAQRIRDAIQHFARHQPGGLLITGEDGVGKTWIAHAVHGAGPRRMAPCLVASCASGLASLAYVLGSPDRAPGGLLGAAPGGTVILDEVDRLAPDVQQGLLRFLESPAGGPLVIGLSRAPHVVSPLLAWLGRAAIPVPPLRERATDVVLLARHFLAGISAALGRPAEGFTAGAEHLLLAHSWPGNVRELRDTVERAVHACPAGPLRPEHLSLVRGHSTAPWSPPGTLRSLREIEDAYIDHVLAATGGNRTRAARILGVARETLRTRMLTRRAAS